MQKLAESDKKQPKCEINDFATFWREKMLRAVSEALILDTALSVALIDINKVYLFMLWKKFVEKSDL